MSAPPQQFSDASGRTYLSSLERGLKSPTPSKVSELCEVMDVHPLALLTLAHTANDRGARWSLVARTTWLWCSRHQWTLMRIP
ncbi:helix-turn-helix transcriptional regulator [Variovorax sp. VRV01]|uniref:helix-turn-helix domain-containing protein n=1 Tax=Variovorax sp. VRV01 TaxID=2769259 RepID=UPI00177E5CB5|nr:helix-turn-helix transcriptional regulator [Variovorax sp. VRV01]